MGQGIGPATLVRRRPDALWRDTPSGVLVLGEGDDVICIEGAGRLLWLVLERPATMAELHRFFSDTDQPDTDQPDTDQPDTDLSTGLDGGVQGLVELGLVDLS